MTGFSLDFNDTMSGAVKDGTYECLIVRCGENVNKNGKELVEFHLIIRNDIQQEHKNQFIFENRYPSNATGKHYMPFFNTVGKAAGLQNGKTYSNFKELLDDYVGKPVKVTVANEESEYQGKTYQNLNIKSWDSTEFPNVQHVHKNNNQQQQQQGGQAPAQQQPMYQQQTPIDNTQVPEEDLPF